MEYYKIQSYQSGLSKTHYSCYIQIYDENKLVVREHPLNDVFQGKWSKCKSVINKWEKLATKNKLERI